jgi:hypothetical protein
LSCLDGIVYHDSCEPWSKWARIIELVDSLIGAHKGSLHNILGQRGVACDQVGGLERFLLV